MRTRRLPQLYSDTRQQDGRGLAEVGGCIPFAWPPRRFMRVEKPFKSFKGAGGPVFLGQERDALVTTTDKRSRQQPAHGKVVCHDSVHLKTAKIAVQQDHGKAGVAEVAQHLATRFLIKVRPEGQAGHARITDMFEKLQFTLAIKLEVVRDGLRFRFARGDTAFTEHVAPQAKAVSPLRFATALHIGSILRFIFLFFIGPTG